ncbi:MAG: hypothetical protein WBA35_13145 [Litorimonas sp.]
MGAALAVGCASTPDVAINYYHAKTDVDVTVLRTVKCSAKEDIVSASTVTVATRHSADDRAPQSLRLADMKGSFADASATVSFYPDGRLQGINGKGEGRGSEILTSAVKLAAAVLPVPFDGGGARAKDDRCTDMNGSLTERGGTVTLKYATTISEATGGPVPMSPTSESQYWHDRFLPNLGDVRVQLAPDGIGRPRVTLSDTGGPDFAPLKTRQPGSGTLTVTTGPADTPPVILQTKAVTVAQFGQPVTVPLPKAASFGTNTFSVKLAETGAITELGYSLTASTAATLDAVTGAIDSVSGQSVAEKAAEAKAEADLIAQQQRLLRCRETPETCI